MILSADFGTSSVKVALIDSEYRLVQTAKRDYAFTMPAPGKVELAIDEVLAAFTSALTDFGSELQKVEALAFDTFAPSVLLLDEKGAPLGPMVTHMDRRSRPQAKQIVETIGRQRFLEITGTLPHAGGVSLTTLLWFMQNGPGLVAKTHTFAHLATYLYLRWTGRRAMDPVNASITGMYETVKGGTWSKEILDAFAIPEEILPPLCEAGQECAPLRPEAARELGLKAGTPVLLGMQDVAAAQLGAGNCQSGDVLFISGSSEMVSILTDKPITNEKYYLRRSAVPGLWQVFSITIGGFALDWFRQEFCSEMSHEEFFDGFLEEQLTAGQGPGTVRFLPYLSGDRQSMRVKRGAFTGLTIGSTRADMLAALVRGIQAQSLRTLRLSEANVPINTPVKATGNLVETGAYLGLKRELFGGLDITVVDNCPLKGNAIVAADWLARNKGGKP